jgi:autotransporter translocation and assembly factor TamB
MGDRKPLSPEPEGPVPVQADKAKDAPTVPASRRKRSKWFLYTLAVIFVILSAGLGVVRVFFYGDRLGNFIEKQLNKGKKGTVEIGWVDWPSFGLTHPRTLPFTANDIVMRHPGRTEPVLVAKRVTGEFDLLGLPDLDIKARNVVVHDATVIVEDLQTDPLGKGIIGFLDVFSPAVEAPPGTPVGPPAKLPFIEVRSVALRNAHVTLKFRGWEAVLENVNTTVGTMRVTGTTRLPDLQFMMRPTVGKARLKIGNQEWVELHDVDVRRFGQFPDEPDALAFALTGRTPQGAKIYTEGRLRAIYSEMPAVDMRLELTEGGPLIEQFSRGWAGGPRATAVIKLSGPLIGPRIELDGQAIKVNSLPADVTVEDVQGVLDLGAGKAELLSLRARSLGGLLTASGKIDLKTLELEGKATIPEPMDVASLVPDDLRPDLVAVTQGTRLRGQVAVKGTPERLVAEGIDVHLGAGQVTGSATLTPERVDTRNIRVRLPDAEVNVRGNIELKKRRLALAFEGNVTKVGRWLERFQLPVLAETVNATGEVEGTLDAPVASAKVIVGGVPQSGDVRADLVYRHSGQTLDIKNLAGQPFGGQVSGGMRVVLGDRIRLENVRLSGVGLATGRVPDSPLAGGLSFDVGGSWTIGGRPNGAVKIVLDDLVVGGGGKDKPGFPLGDGVADLYFDGAGMRIGDLHLGDEGQGRVTITGGVAYPPGKGNRLDLRQVGLALGVELDAFPLSRIPGSEAARLEGSIDLSAKLDGTVGDPAVKGQVSVSRMKALDALLGGAELKIDPWPGGLRVAGRLFQGKLAVQAQIGLSAPFPVEGTLDFYRIDLAEVLPGLSAEGITGWVTGSLQIRTAPALTASLSIADARLTVPGADTDGRPVPIRVRARHPFEVQLAAGRATITRPIVLCAADEPVDGGDPCESADRLKSELTITGSGSAQALAFHMAGDLDLGRMALHVRRYLDGARGKVTIVADLTGTMEKPIIDGKLSFRDAAFRPRNQETELEIPSGDVVVSNAAIEARGLVLRMEGKTIAVQGKVFLAGFTPVAVDGSVKGEVPGKLLELVAPRQITNASGVARADLRVRGQLTGGAIPAIDGTISFDGSGFAVSPRNLRREIVMNGGAIRFTPSRISFETLRGAMDEAPLEIDGSVRLSNYVPLDADVHLHFDELRQRIPETLEVELAGDLRLRYDGARLALSGDVNVVDGRYFQRLSIDKAFTPTRTAESSQPFWDGQPLLETMQLDLNVKTNGFQVSNNVARLSLAGSINVTGTPPNPALDGQISTREGIFNPLVLRVRELQVRNASVTFSRYGSIPEQTPILNVAADAPFVDTDGTEHTIYLTLDGTLGNPQWELWTDTGLNMAQTMELVTTGDRGDGRSARTDLDVGSGTNAGGDSTVGDSSVLVTASDGFAKQITGDVISSLIEDPLKNALSLDCVRLGLSIDSLQLGICKNFSRRFVLNGDYEQGFRGWSRLNAKLDWKYTDSVFLQGSFLRKVPDLASEETENSLRLQLKFRFVIP